MTGVGERQNEAIHPSFDRSISIDFRGAKITSDTGFLLMRQVDEKFELLEQAASGIDDPRSASHTDHSLLQLLRQRVYQGGCKGRSQSGLPYLAERGVLSCCVGFSTHPVLPYSIRLSLPPGGRRNESTNRGGGGVYWNCKKKSH